MATPGRRFIAGHNGRGERTGRFTGRYVCAGYYRVFAPDHPYADRDGYVLEHRLVAENSLRSNEPGSAFLIALGERLYLSPDAVVHHIDGDRLNNDCANLRVMSRGDHTALHHAQGDIR